MNNFSRKYLNNKDYKYKVLITHLTNPVLIAVFKTLDLMELKDSKEGINWSLRDGIFNIEYALRYLNYLDTEYLFNRDFNDLEISFDLYNSFSYSKNSSTLNSSHRAILNKSYITKALKQGSVSDEFSEWKGLSKETRFSNIPLEDYLSFK